MPSSRRPQHVRKIKDYLALKAIWHEECPHSYSASKDYGKFLGHRGKAIKATQDRIFKGQLQNREAEVAQEKAKGDVAFRAKKYDAAVMHYEIAVLQWGHPHNATCYSNLAAALLKLNKWSAAELACKKALREHYSVHGYHHGSFHAKVFDRLGRENHGLGRYEVAIEYLKRAIEIEPDNSEVQADLDCSEEALYAWSDPEEMLEDRKSGFALSEREIQVLVKAGAKPWDEDVNDLLEIAGLGPNTLEDLGDKWKAMKVEDLKPHWEQASDSMSDNACAWCRRPPITFPHARCRGCSIEVYCSERCEVQGWKAHAAICRRSRESRSSGGPLSRQDKIFQDRVTKFLVEQEATINLATLGLLGVLQGDGTALDDHCVILYIERNPDRDRVPKFVEIEKASFEDAKRRFPISVGNLPAELAPIHQREKATGNLGLGVCLVLVNLFPRLTIIPHHFVVYPSMLVPQDFMEAMAIRMFKGPARYWKARFLMGCEEGFEEAVDGKTG